MSTININHVDICFFLSIVVDSTSKGYDKTICLAQPEGLNVCSGGIIDMGET